MKNNNKNNQTFSFKQLLDKNKIIIPIIQRDYAQGRVDKEELREKFLQAIHHAITSSSRIQLDFIYGVNVNDSFQPLDGQQRLTTLFLLHWYAAVKEKISDIAFLEKFSYETRASSREFCKALCEDGLAIEINQNNDNLTSLIIDSSWFFLSWKKDPTVDAMLRTIDHIHRLFKEVDNLWDKLTSGDFINFYYIDLEHFGLTDDLYIKMNARGKLLTDFENFKALFEKRIQDEGWDKGKKPEDAFAIKIDNEWTDLFWKNRTERNNHIDDAFIRFIAFVAMCRQSIESKETIAKIHNNSGSVRVDMFSDTDYKYLCDILDLYSSENLDLDLQLDFPFWNHSNNDNQTLFKTISLPDASYTKKILFFAQTEFLLKNKSSFNKDRFADWMRVIRNIVARGAIERNGKRPDIIRSPEAFDRMIKLIQELSAGCADIYSHLASKEIASDSSRNQTDEERLKAKLIINNPEFRESIFDAEDTNFCRGEIGFLLYCIGFNSSQDISNFNNEKFKKVTEVIKKCLNEDAIDNNLRQGLLLTANSDNQYKFYEYWWSWSYVVKANKRCLIAHKGELEFFVYKTGEYKNYLKNLILKLIDNDLSSLIQNFEKPDEMPKWQYRLIKEPRIIGHEQCPSKYIAISDDDKNICYLMKSQRPRDEEGFTKIEV